MDKINRLVGRNQQYSSSLLGAGLEELTKQATAKTLSGPDRDANAQVIDSIKEGAGMSHMEIVQVLKRRLQQSDSHKQWLAIRLVQDVMQDCAQELSTYTDDLLQEVAKVAARPARRGGQAAQHARQAAMELLRRYGRQGQHAFQMAVRQGGVPVGDLALSPGQGQEHIVPESTSGPQGVFSGDILQDVQQLISMCHGRTDILQDLILGLSSGGSDGGQFERELITELVQDVNSIKKMLPGMLEKLASVDTPEGEAAMMQALEASDMLDNALALHAEVQENLKNPEQVNSRFAPPPVSTETVGPRSDSFSGLAEQHSTPPSLAAAPPTATRPSGMPRAAPPPSQDPFGLDELQDALNSTYQPQQPQQGMNQFGMGQQVPVGQQQYQQQQQQQQATGMGMYQQGQGVQQQRQYGQQGMAPPQIPNSQYQVQGQQAAGLQQPPGQQQNPFGGGQGGSEWDGFFAERVQQQPRGQQ